MRYDAGTRFIHLALLVLGIAALVSGQFAGDYRRAMHTGYDIHRWIGLGMALAVGARLLWGFVGPREARFSAWRERHPGLAGVVQAIGLAAFGWMAVSGAILFALLEPGARAAGWLRAVKELHEGGQVVAIGYLTLHAAAVLMHSLLGDPIWRRMLPWGGR